MAIIKMVEDVRIPEELIIRFANEIAEADKHDLTGDQKAIILYLSSYVKPTDEDFKEYEFSNQILFNLLGINHEDRNKSTKLSQVINSLRDKGFKLPNTRIYIGWLSSCEYLDGSVRLCFDPKIKPLMIALAERKKYTSFKLQYSMAIKELAEKTKHNKISGYLMNFYELLKSNQYKGKLEIEVQDLKNKIGVGNKYTEYTHFRDRILEKAKEIFIEKTDISFIYEEFRAGKRVDVLKIEIKSNIHESNLFDDPEQEINEELSKAVNQMRRSGVGEATVKRFLKDYKDDPNRIIWNVNNALTLYKQKRITKSLSGFIRKSIDNDYRPKKSELEIEQEEERQRKIVENKVLEERLLSEMELAATSKNIDKQVDSFIDTYLEENEKLTCF